MMTKQSLQRCTVGALLGLALVLARAPDAGALVTLRNMQLLAHVNDYPPQIGPYNYSACWAYTHPDGREYAVIGVGSGTAIYNVSDPVHPVNVGLIPGPSSIWREIKSYREWIYIVTEGTGPGEGLQIVRMSDPDHPLLVAAYTTGFTHSHTVAVDTSRALLVCNGTRDSAGVATGMHILSLASPESPQELSHWPVTAAAVPDSQYSHDCVIAGNRLYSASIYSGIVRLFDLADAANPLLFKEWTYPGAFSHNAWPDDSGRWLYVTDERVSEPLKIFDLQDPTQPLLFNTITCNPAAIVHNAHVRGGELYLANYTEGVRVLDIADPGHPAEFAYADSYDGISGDFSGVWEVCPYLPSGTVVASDRNSGLYLYSVRRDYGLVRVELAAMGIRRASAPEGTAYPGAIGGATVYRDGGADSVVTTADGVVVLALDPGVHSLHVKAFGYPDTTVSVTASVGSRDTVEIALVAKPLTRVAGTLRDAFNDQPLVDAEVNLAYTSQHQHTDTNGAYAFDGLPSDQYRIEARAPGYVPVVLTRVCAPDSVRQDFQLKPAPWRDDLETDTGWSTSAPTDEAIAGRWVRVDPLGTSNGLTAISLMTSAPVDPTRLPMPNHEGHGVEGDPLLGQSQPEDDRTPPPGTQCYVTGQGTNPADLTEADVDGGRTSLTSPRLDATGLSEPTIGFWRWFATNTPGDPNDWFQVLLSNDDGVSWTLVSTLTGRHPHWEEQDVRVADWVTPSDRMRVRFVAGDYSGSSIVEAAVDELTLFDGTTLAGGGEPPLVPTHFALSAPTPNPAVGSVSLGLELPTAGELSLDVLDVQGRLVRVLHRGTMVAGAHVFAWDGASEHGTASRAGLYFVRARFGAETQIERVVRLR